MSVECGSCGRSLSDEYGTVPRKPCPDCGETRRIFSEAIVCSVKLSMSAIVSQRYGHTGREVLGAEAEQRAIKWASLDTLDQVLNDPVAEDFRSLLESAPSLSGDKLVLFRGAGIGEAEERPPSIGRMGPLPLHLTPRGGRYHQEGERVLYLADSEDGVLREMEAWHVQGTPYAIRVEVPLESLRIADLSEWPSDHLITAVFSRAELCNVHERQGPRNYIFSQAVGQIVAAKFDGMRIPGVRGAPGGHYKNIVLFRQLKEWPKWTDLQTPPYRLFSPPDCNVAVAAYFRWEKDGCVHGRDQEHWFKAIHDLP